VDPRSCSFCGKGKSEVEHMVAGPTVYICNECVALCAAIVEEMPPTDTAAGAPRRRVVVHEGVPNILVRLPDGSVHGCEPVTDWTPFDHGGGRFEWCETRGRVRAQSPVPVVAVRRLDDDASIAGQAFAPPAKVTEAHARALVDRWQIGAEADTDGAPSLFAPTLLSRLAGLPDADFGSLALAIDAERAKRNVDKPMCASRTSEPCTCRYLETWSAEPGSPLVFDETLNEYQIRYEHGSTRCEMRVRHCPFCGGAAPRSKRASMFAHITSAETQRLLALTKDLRTVADAIERFGPPDEDLAGGFTTNTREKGLQPPTVSSYRTLRYKQLSETADVTLVDYGPERGLHTTLTGKYLG
jgi:hypothetical protein